MKILKNSIIAILVLVLILAGIGFLLPSSVRVERSIEINATPQVVFETLNSFERFNEWSPWYEIDPKADYRKEGPSSGVGAKMSWASENPAAGVGSQEIILSEAPVKIRTHLFFEGQGDAYAQFDLSPAGQGTRVTWSFETEFGNDVVGRWFGVLMFDSLIGSDYEKGLNKLKVVLEK